MATSTFNQSVKQSSGHYANDYLWSTSGNWSTGALPDSTTAVTLSLTTTGPSVVDGTVTVASVSYASGTLLIGGVLIVGGLLNQTGGLLDIAGKATIGSLGFKTATIEGAATVAQIGGGLLTIGNGGSLEVTTSATASLSTGGDSFTLDHGTLLLDSSVTLIAGTSFTFGTTVGSGGSSALDVANLGNFSNFNIFNFTVNNFDVGDSLQFGTLKFTTVSYSGASSHTLVVGGSGPSYTLNSFHIAASAASQTFSLSTAADGGTILTLNCFLAGTRIETPHGFSAIEDLLPGDLVVTMESGRRISRPLRWVGSSIVDLGGMEADAARDAAPVRIRANAFADGIPGRDLLVTSDHCVFNAGRLIPIRMLVNNASIVRETSRFRYTVYHIEFETHSIVMAEGLTVESYLDTGGRSSFGTTDAPASAATTRAATTRIAAKVGATWSDDAAAPLTTGRADVEPLWQQLAARAEKLGMVDATRNELTGFTHDPALCIRLGNGDLVPAHRRNGMRYFFVLPAGATHAVLQSRSAIPAEIDGPFVDDRRRLGVCVRSATLWTELRSTTLIIGMSGLSGWHYPEPLADTRWTNGRGGLALPILLQPTMLEIELSATARYANSPELPQRLRA